MDIKVFGKLAGVFLRYTVCMNYLKSIGAVLAGFITVVVLSMATDFVLEALGIFPPQSAGIYSGGLLAVALLYRTIYTILGGYVTAWLAPHSRMKHVWALAILGQLGGIAGVAAGWNLSAHWYPIALAVLAIPSVYLGGWLYMRMTAKENVVANIVA